MKVQKGFTLIELMIVVAIIGILAVIAIPAYREYTITSNIRACMFEVKAYTNSVTYMLYDRDDTTNPIAPEVKACSTITDATGWTLETMQKIVANTKSPAMKTIECDLPAGSSCVELP